MFDKLVDLFIEFIRLFQFWAIISPYEAGVRVRLGKYHRTLKSGFHWMLPFGIDRVITDNVVIETMRTKAQSLTTKDGIAVAISSVVTFRIEDVKTFLLDVEGRNAVIEDSTYGATSSFIMTRTWDDLNKYDDLGNELAKNVRRQAKRYGAEIISVQLADFARCASLRLISTDHR